MKTTYLLQSLAFVAANALLTIGNHDADQSHASPFWGALDASPDLGTAQPHVHERRNTRAKCSPWFMEGHQAGIPRDAIQERNFTLEKRVMTLPGGDMTEFYNSELTNPEINPIIWEVQTRDGIEDANTADIATFNDVAVSYGTRQLCGCTVLLIVSKRGVYAAHYWENIVFDPDQYYIDKYGAADKLFERFVIKGLTEGVRTGRPTPQVSLKNYKDRIIDGSIRGFLMIPRRSANDVEDGYRNRWNQIKNTVGDLIPQLKPALDEQGQETNDKWKEYKYDAIEVDDRRHTTTPAGKVLIKYDPDHDKKKKISIWMEDSLIYNDDW